METGESAAPANNIVDVDDQNGKNGKLVDQKQLTRKIICRYGRGCTHLNDPVHKERFWHPMTPAINDEQLRTHYICNECGYASPSLQELQLHLQRKTAWSNNSLIGCRISCLIDCKEWHEGYVTQFHKSGKHYVEFRFIGEKRWMNMKKMAFYIVERPVDRSVMAAINNGSSEFKENDQGIDMDGLAPIEDNWVYVDDLSLDYAFAQSVLFKIFGSVVQETGHKTRGHMCLTDDDRDSQKQVKGSLLYGELLPRGANKAFGPKRLAAQDATVLFDLGMGTGKIAIQAFLQFRNLQYVYGAELSSGRYMIAEEAALRMVELLGKDTFKVQVLSGRMIVVTEIIAGDEEHGRVLHLECGNMFDVQNIDIADIVMMETDVPVNLHQDLRQLLGRMHEGARTLSYLDLRRIWAGSPFPFKQMENNKHLSDRFPTSWSVQRGHHFYLWVKVNPDSVEIGRADTTMPGDDSDVGAGATIREATVRKFPVASFSSDDRDERTREDEEEDAVDWDTKPKAGCFPTSFRAMFGMSKPSKKVKGRTTSQDHDHERVMPFNGELAATSRLPGPGTPLVGSAMAPSSSSRSLKRGDVCVDPHRELTSSMERGMPPSSPSHLPNGHHFFTPVRQFDESDNMHTPEALRIQAKLGTSALGSSTLAVGYGNVQSGGHWREDKVDAGITGSPREQKRAPAQHQSRYGGTEGADGVGRRGDRREKACVLS